MSVALELDVGVNTATPAMQRLLADLTDRSGLHESMGTEAENLTRDYLIGIAPNRHKTSQRLGAQPTGHLELAAQSVTSTADNEGATVGITSPGMARAFRVLEIVPVNSKYLTIPATAEAYGRRARSFSDLRLAFFGKGKLALVKAEQSSVATRQRSGFNYENRAPMAKAGRAEVYFWLKKSVTVPQDRTLLPSDALYAAAGEEGAVSFLEMMANRAGI